MHKRAFDFINNCAQKLGPFKNVLEVGSRDINGSVKSLFTYEKYIGTDLFPGPGVDIVVDASLKLPFSEIDCVVCAEVFEHAPQWMQIIENCADVLVNKGVMIITCAGLHRPAHGVSGEFGQRGYYHNVSTYEMEWVLNRFFRKVKSRQVANDIQAVGIK